MMNKLIVLGIPMATLFLGGPRPIAGQSNLSTKTDEQVLRELIQQENQGKNVIKFTEDSIFVSGAYPRPVIGPDAKEQAHSIRSMLNTSVKDEMVRLVVSQAGDMAEEFGNFTMSFGAPDKKRTSFNGSYLRVWRKMDGEWKVDAFFARPNEPEDKTEQKSDS